MKLIASIAHAAHVESRAAQYQRLLVALRAADVPHVTASGRAPGASWALEQWRLGLSDPSATHVLFCSDDVEPCEDFGDVVRAAIAARPEDILCFGNFHHHPVTAERQGLRWLRTTDGVVGQMYAVPRPRLEQLQVFLLEAALTEHLSLPLRHPLFLSDDGLVNLFAIAHGAPVFVTVPALYEHVENASLFETNVDDWGRRSTIRMRPGMKSIDWTGDALECGRTNNLHHRHLIWSIRPDRWREYRVLDRYYDPSAWRLTA